MVTYLARRVALLALVPVIASYVAWFLGGGLAAALDNNPRADGGKTAKDGVGVLDVLAAAPGRMVGRVEAVLWWLWAQPPVQITVLLGVVAAVAIGVSRYRARRDTPRVLMRLRPYRTDQASGEQLVAMYDAIGKALLERWWRRLVRGQQAATLRVRYARDKRGVTEARFFLLCPESRVRSVQSALLGAYPNLTFDSLGTPPADEPVPVVLRLKKRTAFVNRLREVDPRDGKPIHPNQMDRLLSRMDNVAEGSWIDLLLTPPPQSFSHLARRAYRKRQQEIADARGEETASFAPTPLEQKELEGAVDIAHHQLFFADLRVVGDTMNVAERVAAELKVEGAENGLVERGTYLRHGVLRMYARRVRRGDSQPIPGFNRSVLASSELAALFHLPSVNYTQVRVARHSVPRAPAPPEIYRPEHTSGILEDLAGPVALHPAMRSQNMAVVGTVKQGKTSLLVASIAEDLARRDACVILLDPKGDAASAAATIVPPKRGCVILDMANPIVGYNPLAAPAAPDVVADYVVEAMKNIFDEGDIRASSDRYLRNAIMAALAAAEVDTQQTRPPTLEDAVKLLSPTDSGHRERERVSALIRSNPRWVNIHQFFAEELEAQLQDAKAMTTAKLDAPANKAARFLNSPSMQAIFKNTHYAVDFTDIIRGRQVLIVRGALGSMGKENTAVLMQLLVGGLDAALARQQDELEARDRSAVCLKVDEAPLVLNRGFTSTMALKRSAGLEVLAAWQTDSMWEDDDQRAQLDALFAHRCYFQTASADDARHAGNLMMAEYSDQVSTEQHGGRLKHRLPPDVQLHLRPHHALCTWTTPDGRAQPFTATTRPLPDDRRWWDYHLARLAARGAKRVTELVDPGDPTFPEIPAGAAAATIDRGDGAEPDDVGEPADDPLIGTITPPLPEAGREGSNGHGLTGDGPSVAREPGAESEPGERVGVIAGGAGHAGEDETSPAGPPTKVVDGWELPVTDPAGDDPARGHAPTGGVPTNGNGASPDPSPVAADGVDASGGGAPAAEESNGGWDLPCLDAAGHEPNTASAVGQAGSAGSEAAGTGAGRREEPAQTTGTPAADETSVEPEAPVRATRVRRVRIDDEKTRDQLEQAGSAKRQAATPTSPLRKLGSFEGEAPPSFAAFADLDECRRWTHIKTAAQTAIERQKPMPPRLSRERLQPLDLVALARIAEMRFMLADQIGDRFMPDKEKRSVQRRIKLWEDLGLIRRMQFWKKASGASRGPVALYVTDACIEMLKAFPTRDGLLLAENFDSKGPVVEDDAAHFPRHDVRVAGWVSKLEMLAGRLASEIRGPRSAFLRPPRPRDRKDPRPAIGPRDLNSTGRGYEVLDLTDGYGKPADIFNKIEPDAGVLITTRHGDNIRRIDVLVELDRTGEPIKNARKFARYDQLITGWAEAHPRYARFGEGPMAVFVCKDGNQAREFAKAADAIVTGARARTGVPRRDWEYPGRRRMFFVAEGDIHQGMLDSLRLENLPPAVRNADKPKGRRSFNPERVEFFSPALFTRRNGS